jgi:hypothetical protein
MYAPLHAAFGVFAQSRVQGLVEACGKPLKM